VRNDFPFTTTFHTQFPEYVQLRTRFPLAVSYAFMRWFHNAGRCTMVATRTLHERLASRGFTRLGIWSRGVDTELFRPRDKTALREVRPIFLYMGRVAVEKNIEAFLGLDLPGTLIVIGDGPDLDTLKRRYPAVRFLGYKTGEDLARHVAAADVFVFPSLTDTFGLVLIEALACGVPVAAFPVQGPIDVIDNGVTGVLDADLRAAALQALALDPAACRAAALRYTWATCTRQFLAHVEAARQTPTATDVRQPASR
jgi:glycosyltransferase involved in cell wall biosynthesis